MKIVIVGCGTIGRTIVEHAVNEGHTIVVIDDNKSRVEEIIEKYDVSGVVGNGASLDIQEEAQAGDADLVVAVTTNDEVNILACMVAKRLGASSTIARVRNPEYRRQTSLMQEEIGLSMIVNPEQETADEIMSIIDLPSAIKVEHFAKGKVRLVELMLSEGNPLIGETLISMNKKIKTKVLVCAVVRGDDVIIPNGNFELKVGDRISIAADSTSLGEFLTELKFNEKPLRNIIIIGGGKISYYLAQSLTHKHFNVKVFELNHARASELAEAFPRLTVIEGDGTNHDLLVEEGIGQADAVISLTNVDEENIIVSLYAKKQKARKVIAKVKRDSFSRMITELGVVNVITPKDIVAGKIVRYIRALSNKRGSNVITLHKLVNNRVEALEFLAKKKEKIYDKPLKNLKMKDNCLIACIIREDTVIIPNGNDCIKLNDIVLVVTTHTSFDDLTDIFE